MCACALTLLDFGNNSSCLHKLYELFFNNSQYKHTDLLQGVITYPQHPIEVMLTA